MQPFSKLKIHEQKEIINALLFEGLTYQEIREKYGIDEREIAELLDERAVNPYNVLHPKENVEEEGLHKRTFFSWIKYALIASITAFFSVVFVQSSLGGFESQIVTDSLAYITQPLSKIVNLGLGLAFILFVLYYFFPILSKFINYKVNTVYLQEEFMKSGSEAKLKFLSSIFLALCLLVGLVFSAKGQTQRELIISTAYKEVGTLEVGGNNKGKRIDEYRSVALGKTVKGYQDAWCGYFVAFVYRSCNIPYKVNFSPRARDWFSDSKKIVWRKNFQYSVIKKPPQKGDLIGYVFRAGTIGHIEILYEWHEDYFLAIGGNTSNKNTVYRDANSTDGVRLKKRNISTAYIIANHID